jgi:hypothetical protein
MDEIPVPAAHRPYSRIHEPSVARIILAAQGYCIAQSLSYEHDASRDQVEAYQEFFGRCCQLKDSSGETASSGKQIKR